jgi:hypothetical protein
MKHLKTFESFNQSVDEGFLDNFLKPELNKTHKKLITDTLKGIDTNKFKFMQVMGKEKTKKEFSVDGYLKMVEDIDNYNGKVITKGDVVYYQPASFKGNDGGFSKSGNVAS